VFFLQLHMSGELPQSYLTNWPERPYSRGMNIIAVTNGTKTATTPVTRTYRGEQRFGGLRIAIGMMLGAWEYPDRAAQAHAELNRMAHITLVTG